MQSLLAESAEPVVLNVWASWCTPCRSEAPLLGKAAEQFEAEVRFIGLDVRDTPRRRINAPKKAFAEAEEAKMPFRELPGQDSSPFQDPRSPSD
jgi:thiol-disulfide isomerase/thioredoxin